MAIRLTRRQKTLLCLPEALGGAASDPAFQARLFLLCQEEAVDERAFFDFFPHLQVGFSFTEHSEKPKLIESGILATRRIPASNSVSQAEAFIRLPQQIFMKYRTQQSMTYALVVYADEEEKKADFSSAMQLRNLSML